MHATAEHLRQYYPQLSVKMNKSVIPSDPENADVANVIEKLNVTVARV